MPAGENETAYSYESVASKLLRFGPGSVSPSFSSLKKRETQRESQQLPGERCQKED